MINLCFPCRAILGGHLSKLVSAWIELQDCVNCYLGNTFKRTQALTCIYIHIHRIAHAYMHIYAYVIMQTHTYIHEIQHNETQKRIR